ncbi:MAG: YihY/virulence factor BrkB family protein [Gemmataceae bacterium]
MLHRMKAAATGWVEDQAGQMGAALAYYTLFSLTPLLVLALMVLGVMFNQEDSRTYLLDHLGGFLNEEGTKAIEAMVNNFLTTTNRSTTSALGLGALVFGASGMFTSLRSSLQRIWRLPPVQEGVIASVVKTYMIALTMVLFSCAFIVALFLGSAMLAVVTTQLTARYPVLAWAGPLLNVAASALLLSGLFLFTYRFLSDGRLPFSRLVGGAVVSAILFTFGKMAISYYLALTNLASLYGAAGSLVVFLAWVYYSAQIIFFGAEVIRFGLPTSETTKVKPERP